MAGGKSKRFNFDKVDSEFREKTLLRFKERYLIDHIIDATLATRGINRIIIAVSPFTPHTKSILELKKHNIEVMDTPGTGYHEDLSYIIKTLKLGVTMTIAADIPLIKSNILDNIIKKYFIFKKPALAVMANLDLFKKYGLTATIKLESKDSKKELVPLGINIIDGSLIDENELRQALYISRKVELIYNINTTEDYFQLRKIFNKKNNFKDI